MKKKKLEFIDYQEEHESSVDWSYPEHEEDEHKHPDDPTR